MSDHSDVTVVMPTYNRGKELMEAVASIRAQPCRPAAIVVVDDGSDDDRALEVLEFVEYGGEEVVGIRADGWDQHKIAAPHSHE